jgi:hypothetical protein
VSAREIRWGRPAPWLAAIGGLGALATVIGSTAGILEPEEWMLNVLLVCAVPAWGIPGTMIGRRRPENPIGLLLAFQAFLIGVVLILDEVARASPGTAIATFTRTRRAASCLLLMGSSSAL